MTYSKQETAWKDLKRPETTNSEQEMTYNDPTLQQSNKKTWNDLQQADF